MTERSDKRSESLRRARFAHNFQWPAQLESGVMFYEGERITRAEFDGECSGDGDANSPRAVPCPVCGCGSPGMPCTPSASRDQIIEECAKALEPANQPLLLAAVKVIRALKGKTPQPEGERKVE